jgi:hypothetical protein
MKILIAALSCELFRTNGNNQAMRDTWLPDVKGADYKIFMGQGSQIQRDDEVFLDAPDGYDSVTYKAKEMYKWAQARKYEYIFRCFPDTYVCPSRLLDSGFEKYDYSGNFAARPLSGAYACGGAGCWFSRKAYETLIQAPIPVEDVTLNLGRPLRLPNSRGPVRPHPGPTALVLKNIEKWADDKWSGDVMRNTKSIVSHHDPRYEDQVLYSGPEAGNARITQHLSRPVREGSPSYYDKSWLYEKHKAWINSFYTPKVAVITPTLLSRHALLEECKASVITQQYGGEIYHAIGVDQNKEGPSVTRNKIVQNLDESFEWLAFCDDDDKLSPNHIATLMVNKGSADIVYSNSQEEGFSKTWQPRDFNHAEVKADNYIPVTVLMRRSLFYKIGGFQTEPFPGEDQNLWLRADLAGAKFKYVPQVTWTYRKHPQHRSLCL